MKDLPYHPDNDVRIGQRLARERIFARHEAELSRKKRANEDRLIALGMMREAEGQRSHWKRIAFTSFTANVILVALLIAAALRWWTRCA